MIHCFINSLTEPVLPVSQASTSTTRAIFSHQGETPQPDKIRTPSGSVLRFLVSQCFSPFCRSDCYCSEPRVVAAVAELREFRLFCTADTCVSLDRASAHAHACAHSCSRRVILFPSMTSICALLTIGHSFQRILTSHLSVRRRAIRSKEHKFPSVLL